MQDGGGALRIGKPKAVGSNPTPTAISLYIISLFSSFFLFSLDHFIYTRKLEYRKNG